MREVNIPTWGDYERECNHPVTEAEYTRYVRENYKDVLEDLE